MLLCVPAAEPAALAAGTMLWLVMDERGDLLGFSAMQIVQWDDAAELPIEQIVHVQETSPATAAAADLPGRLPIASWLKAPCSQSIKHGVHVEISSAFSPPQTWQVHICSSSLPGGGLALDDASS